MRLEMVNVIIGLFTAVLNPISVDNSANMDIFLKQLNTPSWHWVFRATFGLCLIVSILVYFYYRNKNDRN
jgi:hypothetical protein